jgi:glycosidase
LRLNFNSAPEDFNRDIQTSKISKKESMECAAVLAFTLPGIPLIYNGEEAGNRKSLSLYDKVDIDWSRGSDHKELYKKLCDFRRNHPALRYGSYALIRNTESNRVYSFLRSFNSDSVFVVINIAKDKKDVNLQLSSGPSRLWKDEFTGVSYRASDSGVNMKLPPFGYAVLSTTDERNIK